MTSQECKNVLVDYLRMKISEEDWHAVADAAMDLRELEVEIRIQHDNTDTERRATDAPRRTTK